MSHRAIDQVFQRVQDAKSESDFNYFFSLLLAGEALFKTVTLGLIAALDDDKDRNRYRLEYSLARADGLGEWGRVLEDALSGPGSQFLLADARNEQAEFTRISGLGTWQYDAVSSLKSVVETLIWLVSVNRAKAARLVFPRVGCCTSRMGNATGPK